MGKNFLSNLFNFVSQPGLGKTILFWFLVLSLVPLLIASVISYLKASDILQEDAKQFLNSVSRLKSEYIDSFFNERIKDLNLISQLTSNVKSFNDIINEYEERKKTSGESLEEFLNSLTYKVYKTVITLDMENFVETYSYNDIFLLDLDGNIMVVVVDENMVGTNIFNGKFSQTKFAKACREVLETGESRFSDIDKEFGSSGSEAAGFLIQLMMDEQDVENPQTGKMEKVKTKVGIMAIQISMKQINQIMQKKLGDTKTGVTYLIGDDKLMRSGSTSELLEIQVNTEGARRWLDRKFEKSQRYSDYRGEKVLGVNYNLDSLEKLGVHWGLLAEINESEAFGSSRNLLLMVGVIVLSTIVIVFLISILATRRIVEPVRKLSGWAKQVAIGDLSYEEITSEKNEIGEMNASFKEVVDSFRAVTDVCETIAIGDFTKTVSIRSEKDALGKTVNQMKDNLVEVVRQANNISMGDYSGEVGIKSEKDMLGIALERMTRTLRDAAMVAEEVSIGDYGLELEIKGEKDMLGKALNQMIHRLRESNADSQRKIDYLNNIPTPVHVIDNNFNIQFINHAGALLVGKTVDDCMGRKCYALFNATHCQTERCRSFRAMNQDRVLTGDMVSHLPDLEIPLRYTSAPIKDSLGNIIGAIEYMADISDEMQVVELAEKISRGDYSVKVQKRSDEDRLSDALNRMTYSLREAVEQNKKQNWLKSGQTELNNRMRGELDIPELSQNIISFLTSYLDAQLGLLYFITKPGALKLVGSYALGKEKGLLKKFKFGEGIVGQAAEENRVIEITDIPRDFVKIRTGFGDITPRHVIVMPFTYETYVIGVIEIASLHEFTEIQKEFLSQSLENIGIALNSAESRRQLKELLQKTQEQAERLQAQQEELRQSNEELEGQTKALIASETNLQTQQEELRVINEELEERTRMLEKQKADIEQKNIELMNARNEIEKKAKDLEEVSKYKSEFLANMSHELRTPLNSILILSQLLANNREENLSKKQVEFARTIHTSGSDLLSLINEILDLSKIEAGMMELRIEPVSIEEFASNLRRIFKPVAANKKIQFNIDTRDKNLPREIYTDNQRAQQIVKNLLSNAFKFTDRGSITLRIYRPGEDVELDQSGLSRDKAIAIDVADTGIGIPDEKRAVIFEAFHQEDGTTSRKYGGTGLGLSISSELAELLGGEIQLKTKKEKGSTFTLFLPEKLEVPGKVMSVDTARRKKSTVAAGEETRNLKQEEKEAIKEETANPGAKLKKEEEGSASAMIRETPLLETRVMDSRNEIRDDRKTIKPQDKSLLIIEDDNNFAEVLLNLAQSKGFKCVIAEDGETGLHFADFYKPSAIILDVRLPGMDGWQVMERLKHSHGTRHIPVHFMSAMDDTYDAMRMGAIGYLSKPVDTETLDAAFKKIENVISKPVKKLLVVEGGEAQKNKIIEMMGSGGSSDVVTMTASTGEEALHLLKKENFDSMILNPALTDMTGFELLEKIDEDKNISQLPIIIYSERELTPGEEEALQTYAQRIIVKDSQSLERLFAETSLFLHRVESQLPESQQQMLNRILDKEDVLKGKKVLIVDDDMRNVFALTSILEEKGMKTVVGKNGKEGLEKLQSEPDFDLVLMDIMMPVMDGYQAMKAIRKDKRFEKLPIIALTAKAMKGDRHKCVTAGASDYLAKPVSQEKLLSLLRVWLYE
ncbi:MAG: response regulator [Candidatus Aminicenantes bacterium]|nr:MAG: response regulator [Candidatus Aminicenantes bacterium]